MPRYRILLEYDGAAFSGWQLQPGHRTVQEELERAIGVFAREPARVAGAGRPDAGVHALGQVAAFDLAAPPDLPRAFRAFNGILPKDCRVLSIAEAPAGFDPRRAATGKTYRYRILNRPAPPAVRRGFVLHYPWRLDAVAMVRAAAAFKGTHDFGAFRAADCEAAHAVRHVHHCRVTRNEEMVVVEVTATAFVKNMVRIMVGTLIEIGNGRRPEGSIAEALESRDRAAAGVTAPPQGLFLAQVYYAEEGGAPAPGLEWPSYAPGQGGGEPADGAAP